MEVLLSTPEQLEAVVFRAMQKNNPQPSKKEDFPEFIGTPEARKLLESIWGIPISDSWFSKKSMVGELPFVKVGKRRVFNRLQLIEWAKSKTIKPIDPVSTSVQKSAMKKF